MKDAAVWEESSNEREDEVDIEQCREQMRLQARHRMEEKQLLDIADDDEDQVASAAEKESSIRLWWILWWRGVDVSETQASVCTKEWSCDYPWQVEREQKRGEEAENYRDAVQAEEGAD